MANISPIESKKDNRLGWHEADQPVHWPSVDVYGNPYNRPASTQSIPNMKGYFVVVRMGGSVPLKELEEATVKLRAPAVEEKPQELPVDPKKKG